jgi:peroxiredoxin Q/BCP
MPSHLGIESNQFFLHNRMFFKELEIICGSRLIQNFSFTATSGIQAKLSDFKGQWLVLYFYPKDNTPGCTSESKNFRDAFKEFQKQNTVIFGVSRDTLISHEKFKAKYNLPFDLISDPEGKLCEIFNVINIKNILITKIHYIQRSTFLFSPEGKLVKEWRKVSVCGHVEQVLETIKQRCEI